MERLEHVDAALCGCEACQMLSPLEWEETTQYGLQRLLLASPQHPEQSRPHFPDDRGAGGAGGGKRC